MNITEQIENNINELKNKRYNDDKIKQYSLIASSFRRYFKQTGIKTFQRSLILSFFTLGEFPTTTQGKHIKNILNTLKENGTITDDVLNKVAKQRRIYELKSKDFGSYTALMNDNGFKEVVYYKFYCDSDGIPRRRKVGKSEINAITEDDDGNSINEKGEIIGDYDISVLKQTIPRRKQGVYSYGNKSIAIEKRAYNVKGFKVTI